MKHNDWEGRRACAVEEEDCESIYVCISFDTNCENLESRRLIFCFVERKDTSEENIRCLLR